MVISHPDSSKIWVRLQATASHIITYTDSLKELRHGDFQFFWSKRPQIITKYLCRKHNTYGTLRGRYQVDFQRKK